MRKFLLITLCLLLLLQIGCAAGTAPTTDAAPTAPAETEPTETPTEEPAEAPAEAPAEEPADVPAEEPAEEPAEAPAETEEPDTGLAPGLYYNPEHPYWVDEEMQTISFSINYNSGVDGIMTPNDSEMIDELEAATNVHVEWEIITAPEAYSVMLASGEYCDLIIPLTPYPGGLGKAIEDGVTVDVTDLIDACMPNYKRVINENPNVYRETHSDDGRNYAIYSIICNDFGQINPAIQPMGLAIREDWLNDLSLESPTTIAEWDVVLQAFKDEKNATAPLFMPYNSYFIGDGFLTAYGCLSSFYVDPDGETIKYGPLEEGYLKYLTLMNDWYERGLITADFISGTYQDMVNSLFDGTSGAGVLNASMSADWFYRFGFTDNENIMLRAVEFPVENEGDVPQRGGFRSYVWTTVVMSADCENQEAAARWLDYMYTYEGMLLVNFGIENEGYYFDDNGLIYQTEQMLSRPENAIFATNSASIYTLNVLIGLNDTDTYMKQLTEPMVENLQNFTNTSNAMALPTMLSLSVDESETLAETYSDIETYVAEMTARYIMGLAPLEEYETFVQELYAMSIKDCIEAYQTAYTRYINR